VHCIPIVQALGPNVQLFPEVQFVQFVQTPNVQRGPCVHAAGPNVQFAPIVHQGPVVHVGPWVQPAATVQN
jgi:hypothetical protein